ncbi:5663_t:CDS:1 [Acaulospora colombiana]|uniref:5663_t:CDS:1 n=1 Tax=Acaulospora colombiana TaxID=27376 RepID=A0ACA9LUG2_9GLOM|nr:5663_t:CDS:1 [Acaulospora colombiana]
MLTPTIIDSSSLSGHILWSPPEASNSIRTSLHKKNQNHHHVISRHQRIFLQRIHGNGLSPLINIDKIRYAKQLKNQHRNDSPTSLPDSNISSRQIDVSNKYESLPSYEDSPDAEDRITCHSNHICQNQNTINSVNLKNSKKLLQKGESSAKLNNRDIIVSKSQTRPVINNTHPFNHHHRKNDLCSIGSYLTLLLNQKPSSSLFHGEQNENKVDNFTNAFGSLMSVQSPPGDKRRRMILVNPPSISTTLGNINISNTGRNSCNKNKNNVGPLNNIYSLYDMVCPTPCVSRNFDLYFSDCDEDNKREEKKLPGEGFDQEHEYYEIFYDYFEESALPSSAMSTLEFSIRSQKVTSPISPLKL